MTKISPAGIALILVTVMLTVVGQILVKKGVLQIGASPTQITLLPRFFFRVFTSFYVLAGLACALAAAASWALAVSRLDLSLAYPFMGLAIVLVLALSGFWFGETVPIQRWIGVLIVCVGIAIAARS